MKKLVVLMLVLAMAQISMAGLATLRVAANDVKNDYTASDTVTIELVTDQTVSSIAITSVTAALGTASAPVLNALFVDAPVNPGVVVNTAGNLINSVTGFTALGTADIAAGAILWSFEFHVPDVPASTTIDIGTFELMLIDGAFENFATETAPLSLHVVPEPMTMALLGLGGLFLRRRK